MIRFIYIGDQIEEDGKQFAFFNTCNNKFVTFEGEEVFDSVKDFKFYKTNKAYERCFNNIPEEYKLNKLHKPPI